MQKSGFMHFNLFVALIALRRGLSSFGINMTSKRSLWCAKLLLPSPHLR